MSRNCSTRGIDVWTALNIQHLESLADVVSRITGVVVRETVPDSVLQRRRGVVLVDITPDELIQRLQEGKVYLAETARRADAEILHAAQSDRAARTGAAPHRGRASTTRWSIICARTPSKAPGRRPSGCWSASDADERRRWSWCARRARLATGLNAELDRGLCRATGPKRATPRRVTRSTTALRLARAARRGNDRGCPATTCRRDPALRAAREHHADRRRPLARGLSRPPVGRSLRPTRWCAAPRHRRAYRHRRRAARSAAHDAASPLGPPRRCRSASLAAAVGRSPSRSASARLLDAGCSLPNLSMIFLIAVLVCAARFGLRVGDRGGCPVVLRLRFLLHPAATTSSRSPSRRSSVAAGVFSSSP